MATAHLNDIVDAAPAQASSTTGGVASLDDIIGPALKPKTPQETKEFLQGRYGNILKQNTDPSNLGIAKEVLIGAGKTAARDTLSAASFLDPVSNIQRFRGKPVSLMNIAPGEPEGEAQEFGSIATTSLEVVPAVVSLTGMAASKVIGILSEPGGAAKLLELAHTVRHPISSASFKVLRKLLTPEAAEAVAKRPGLRPPKYGGAYEPEIGAAPGTRVPRGKFTPVENPVEKFQPFKPNPKTAAKLRPGGAPEPFDEGASRLPVKKKLEPKVKSKIKEKTEALEASPTSPTAPVKPTPKPTLSAGKPGSGFDTGSEPSITSIKHEARHTDAMRAVFANARNLGVDSKALREAAKQFYGKGISEMSYEEVVDLNERLLMNKAVPKK